MRKLIPALLLSFGLCLTLTLLIVGSTSAQEPDTSPAKGSDPLPIIPSTEPAAPKLALDPTLLVKIEPQLLKKLLQSGQEPVPFVVYLKATTNLAAIAPITPSLGAQKVADPLVRRTAIVNALQQTARDSQAGVLQTLNSPPRTANSSAQVTAASEIHPLWIINAVAAKGSLDLVLALAARPDVQVVRLDKEIKLEGSREMEKWRNGGMEEWRKHFTLPPFHPPTLPTSQSSNSPALQLSSPPTFQPSNLPIFHPPSPPTFQPSNPPTLQSPPPPILPPMGHHQNSRRSGSKCPGH